MGYGGYFSERTKCGGAYSFGRSGVGVLGVVFSLGFVSPAFAFTGGAWASVVNGITMDLANGGTGQVIGQLVADSGEVLGWKVGYVNSAGAAKTVVVSSPAASIVDAEISAMSGESVLGRMGVSAAGTRAGLLARGVAWASSLPAMALAFGLAPSRVADGTFSAAIPASWSGDLRKAAYATGLTQTCHRRASVYGGDYGYENDPCINVVLGSYAQVHDKVNVAGSTIGYMYFDYDGWPKYQPEITAYQSYSYRVYYTSADDEAAWNAEFDAALSTATDAAVNTAVVTTLQGGQMVELPPHVFTPLPVTDVDTQTALDVTNPVSYPDFGSPTVVSGSGSTTQTQTSVTVNFPTVMDVNVKSVPPPVEIQPTRDGTLTRDNVDAGLLSLGSGWLPRSCPIPRTFDTRFGSGEISFQPLCDAVSMAGPILVGFSFLIGIGIVVGSKV